MPHFLILIPACAGFTVTAIFMRNYRVERACGERGQCTIVAETQQARFLKVRNTTAGFVFYSALIAMELARLYFGGVPALLDMYEQTAIWIAAGMSFYLFYQLQVILKLRCPLCYTAHAINVFMAMCLVAGK